MTCKNSTPECLAPYCDCDEDAERPRESACSIPAITATRLQATKLRYLEEKGGKYSAGAFFVQMPNGDFCTVDPFGRVEWKGN
jgi:hypothetical protein